MSADTYMAAFAEAQAELSRVREQFEDLRQRKEKLEAAVLSLEQLLPSPQQELPMELPPREDFSQPGVKQTTRRSSNATRKLAVEAIKKAGRPLTVPEIHFYMASIMGGVTPKKESIRVLMIRRTDTFRKVGDGLYSLVDGYATVAPVDIEES
jgi:hypothetical protein